MLSTRCAGTATPSRARSDGLDASDRRAAAEAVIEWVEGLVMPVIAERPEDDAEDWEPGPVPWPIWW